MNILRRSALFLLAAVMVFSAVGCGADQSDDRDENTTTSVSSADNNNQTENQTDTSNQQNSSVDSGNTTVKTPVDASYFNDVAFVGDSVSYKLELYAMKTGDLGSAQFFTAGSLGANNALWTIDNPEAVHPSYRGEVMLIEDCIANSGANKVYIMFGMNDLAIYGIDTTIESYKTLVANILAKSPDVEIIIQSMTPMTDTSNIMGDYLNNDVIREYNVALQTMCEEMGWGFVDVASVMYDDAGNLIREYCSDPDQMGVHFEDAGCEEWIEYLCNNIP